MKRARIPASPATRAIDNGSVRAGLHLLVGLLAGGSIAACPSASAQPSTETVEVSGIYVSRFETSRFTPCGTDEDWWVHSNPDFRERYGRIRKAHEKAIGKPVGRLGGPEVFVHLTGERIGPGRYGHLGGYAYELRVTGVQEMRARTEMDCKLGPSATAAPLAFPAPKLTCVRDEDCGTHHWIPNDDGGCCTTCAYRIGARIWTKAVRRLCREAGSAGCPMKKCRAPPPVACVAGKCQAAK